MQRKYYPQVFIGLLSIILGFLTEYMIEFLIEDVIEGSGYDKLSIPIAILFSLLINISLLLNFDLINKIPSIENLLKKITNQENITIELLENLKNEEKRIQKIYSHLISRQLILKTFGSNLVESYMAGFSIVDHGIKLDGEHWALKTYTDFWRYIAIEQEKKFIDKDVENYFIARVTHSNSVSIWQKDNISYKKYVQELFLYQKKFTEFKGIIVRMLIGPTPEPDENYQKAIDNMEEIGIEVKYFYQRDVVEREFDFLLLADEEIILKWHSSANGQKLAGCTILDKTENEVIRTWAHLFEKAKDNKNPVRNIPKDRQYHY